MARRVRRRSGAAAQTTLGGKGKCSSGYFISLLWGWFTAPIKADNKSGAIL